MRGLVGKSGAAHFEMIISFMFFTGFVFFLFVALKPQDTLTLSDSVISGLYDSFEEMAYTNLSNVFLKASYDEGGGDCFKIRLPGNIFNYEMVDRGSHVTSLGGDVVGSGFVGGNLNINKDGEFFRIAFSPEFEDDGVSGCGASSDYELGSVVERKVISYRVLERMSEEYVDDYDDLKARLKVPGVFDFAIVPERLSDVRMEPRLGIPGSVDVMAREYVFGVLKSDGSFSNERFSFRIW